MNKVYYKGGTWLFLLTAAVYRAGGGEGGAAAVDVYQGFLRVVRASKQHATTLLRLSFYDCRLHNYSK